MDLREREGDDQRRKRAVYVGFALGILMTLGLYLAVRADPYGESLGAVPLLAWLSPLAVAALLGLTPRTRSLGAGLAVGVGLAWIVGVPACVVVTLNTVPL